MASSVYLWSSLQKSRAEAHQPNPSFQAHEPMHGISTTSRFNRATPAPASARADALAFPAKRPHVGLGLDFMGQIRLLKIFYQLTGTIPSLADQSFHPPSTYSTIDHDTLSYYRSLLIALLASPSAISPVYMMSEGAGFPVAMAGPRDPSPDSAFPDLFRIPGLEDPSRFPFGPSVTMMSGLLPSQPSGHGSYIWEVYLKQQKLSNGKDLVFGEVNSGGRDLMKVAINGSDLPGLNIENVKAVDEGTSKDFGGKAQWPGSSCGLHVFKKNENNVPKKKGKAAVNRHPKVYNFFPVKKVRGKGKRGGRKPAPLAKAKATVGPIDLTLKLRL
ncbi:hypothetical protein AAC387_Pa07g0583 [Persea americana]